MNKKYIIHFMVLFIVCCFTRYTLKAQEKNAVEWWLTNTDKSALIAKQPNLFFANEKINDAPAITVDDAESYQTMDGFGFALTGGSAIVINRMEAKARNRLLHELFAKDDSAIATSYLRISIGASDLSDRVFTYNDLPKGQTDVEMKHFSIETEQKDLLPVLKEILQINPQIKILGSPWSPPVWMKTNGKSKGGRLLPVYYEAYALYFVKYIEAMKAEGIAIDAITIQNEPLHPGNNPSLYMPAKEQALFIKKSLGPAFKKAGIATKIIIYDHNPNRIDYPIELLNDKAAAQYVDGTAFHMYEGKVDAITKVHDAHPGKHIYFTEQWVGVPGNFAGDFSWHIKTLMIGAVRNWCKNVIEWNLAADPNQDPHTPGGCYNCLGAVTIDGNIVTRNPAYYIIAQASKFVMPGAVRIKTNMLDKLPNVAFKTPEGKIVLLVQNDSKEKQLFQISHQNKYLTASLEAGSVASITFPSP